MKLESLGDVIAEREFLSIDPSGARTRIRISLGKPKPFSDSADFYCPYQISGVGDEKIRYAGGVDSMQAIQLALQIIGPDLSSTVGNACKLTWEAGENDADLGFSI